MKTNILRLMMAAVLFAGLTMAQGQKRGRMMQDLGLNEDQKSQVHSIMKERRAAAQAARSNNASKDELRAIHKRTHDRLAAVLNEEQMQKFEAGAKKQHKRRKAQG